MTPAENALALAQISIRFSIFWAEIDEAITGRGNLIHDRAFDLWRHYFNRATAHLKPMTVREQIEAVGWTRECGQTVRRSDGALAEYVECDPAVNQVQAWIVAGCPASNGGLLLDPSCRFKRFREAGFSVVEANNAT